MSFWAKPRDGQLWALAHAERAALAEDLSGLSDEQWRHGTLCGKWDVEEVVAHMTAAASLGQWKWLRSMAGRPAYLEELSGPGVQLLRTRIRGATN